MGGKRTGKRKLVYCCIAALISFLLGSCTAFQEGKKAESGKELKALVPKGMSGGHSAKEEYPAEEEGRRPEARVKTAPDHLAAARKLLGQGDYEGSFRESQKALALAGRKPPGDEAFFHMGLIYAHYRNPRRDYGKSADFFGKLLKDYPQSSLAEQARIWIGVLHVIEKSKQVDIEIEEMKKELLR